MKKALWNVLGDWRLMVLIVVVSQILAFVRAID
jgi:hypothetical protein